jgi:hypothetical protein
VENFLPPRLQRDIGREWEPPLGRQLFYDFDAVLHQGVLLARWWVSRGFLRGRRKLASAGTSMVLEMVQDMSKVATLRRVTLAQRQGEGIGRTTR